MNCIRCQAPLRKQLETEVGAPISSCISCRSLWFEKNEIRLALGVNSLGQTGPKDGIGFQCPHCPNSELFNYRMSGVKQAIISCSQCLGAWIDGGTFSKLKQDVKNAGGSQGTANPLYSESVAINIPQNTAQQTQKRDWVMILAVAFLVLGSLAVAAVLLKKYGMISL